MPGSAGRFGFRYFNQWIYCDKADHLIDKSKEIEVTLNDNRTFKAKLVKTSRIPDIALIKIEAKVPGYSLGNSDSLKVR